LDERESCRVSSRATAQPRKEKWRGFQSTVGALCNREVFISTIDAACAGRIVVKPIISIRARSGVALIWDAIFALFFSTYRDTAIQNSAESAPKATGNARDS
jgi:hypothetical protein